MAELRAWQRSTAAGSLAGWLAAAAIALLASLPASGRTYSIADYFPLQPASAWTLQDVDGEPADEEGFTWTVLGAAPQTVGSYSAWPFETDTVAASDSREGDRHFWNSYNGGKDLGLYGLYEKAGMSPLAADQTIAFSQPLRFGTEGMTPGWSATATASATFRVTVPFFGTIPVAGTATSTVTFVQHLDSVDTPRGIFYDVVVLTADLTGTASLYSLTLEQSTLFLARGIGLVRYAKGLDPASTQVQALASGQLNGSPIAPLPPPAAQGVTVRVQDEETSEDGEAAALTVVLDAAPTQPVSITLTCDDVSEAAFAAGAGSLTLVFSTTDWNVPQAVAVNGVDDTAWDGHQVFHLTLAISSLDPDYAALDPTPWRVTLTNLDNETIAIGDYFVLTQGSGWLYQLFDEDAGPVPAGTTSTWTVEAEQPVMHGVTTTAIRVDVTDVSSPLNGVANLWSLEASGDLLLHGIRLPTPLEQDVDYLGGTYHVVVPPQTLEFDAPLVTGTRAMVTHAAIIDSTAAALQVSGLPLVSTLPVAVSSHTELLEVRERKRTPLGAFYHTPAVRLTVSLEAMGQSVQDQGGVLFLASGVGVIAQNAADAPDSPRGMALAGGSSGTDAVVANDSDDRRLCIALTLNHGWNLVSLPFRPLVSSPAAVFGDAILGYAWEQRGQTVAVATQLCPGEGYWVYRDPSAAADGTPLQVLVTGTPGASTTRTVERGWVLAGVIGDDPTAALVLSLPVGGAAKGPAAIRPVGWCWESGRYLPVRRVPAGVGAWLLVEHPGVVDLAPAAAAKSETAADAAAPRGGSVVP